MLEPRIPVKEREQQRYAVRRAGLCGAEYRRILGMGADHYPVPWRLLKYDSELDGYRSDISGNRLKGYPKSVFGSSGSELFDWNAKRAELDSYYDNVDTVTTKEGAENPMTRSGG
jgi:hypothetical protein